MQSLNICFKKKTAQIKMAHDTTPKHQRRASRQQPAKAQNAALRL
jgi:hypothetical protein